MDNETNINAGFFQVVAPLIAEELREYFGKQSFVISRADDGYYSNLLSIELLDSFLEAISPNKARLEMVNSRAAASVGYTMPDETVDLRQVANLYRSGSTLILKQMQEVLPGLSTLCRSAQNFFRFRCKANVYITPPNSQGLATHKDGHDVFILQIEGEKKWRIYKSGLLKIDSSAKGTASASPYAESNSILLRAGDMLYIPSGTIHDAETEEHASVHVTLGVIPFTWADILKKSVDVAIAKNYLFDSAFTAVELTEDVMADQELKFKSLLRAFTESASLRDSVDEIIASLLDIDKRFHVQKFQL